MNEYKYEYYLQKTNSTNRNMNIILDTFCHKYEYEYNLNKIVTNISEYSNIFKSLKIFDSQITATCQSEDCLLILIIKLNISRTKIRRKIGFLL